VLAHGTIDCGELRDSKHILGCSWSQFVQL